MTGSVELDQDGTQLLIRFQYREDLVALVKDLPGRRWDPKQKQWRVPATHVELVYAALSRHLFDFAPEITQLLAGTRGVPTVPAKPAAPAGPPLPLPGNDEGSTGDAPALSVSQLNTRVRDGLRQQFPTAFWVVGEIVDFDKGAGRQHRFFQLIEKARGEARPHAAVEIALFANTAERLLPRLAAGEHGLTLRDGIEIRVLVKVDLYPATGRYQVVVQDIDPMFTLGKMALSREQILRELVEKGLATRNRSLGFPVPALRIGVLTSPDGDGWNDFLRHLQEARLGFQVTLFPTRVQGIDLRPNLLSGLAWFAANEADFDLLCIVRGGGSRTDLAWFDDRDVALAVARHPLKICIGIGHQRDQSVLDAIAHSEKTPTAVAELLVRGVRDAQHDVITRAQRLLDAVGDQITTRRTELHRLGNRLVRAAEHRLRRAAAELAATGRDLGGSTALRLLHERTEWRTKATRSQAAAARRLERGAMRIEHNTTRQRLLDPRRIVARGYVVVRDRAGRVLPAAARLGAADAVRLQFRDGHADARIDHVHLDPR